MGDSGGLNNAGDFFKAAGVRPLRSPRRIPRYQSRGLAVERLEGRQLLAANPIISEFMALNSGTLVDADGDAPDWVEIHNAGDMPVDLDGWSLTDDLAVLGKWHFPDIRLDPGGYLLLLASGKDLPQSDIHLIQDFHATPDGTFLVDLPEGSYDVRVSMGDFAQIRDQMAIYLQGEQVDTLTTQAGQVVDRFYVAQVSAATGGQLRLRLRDEGGQSPRAVINGLVITPSGGGAAVGFDFGRADSPLHPDFIRVTETSVYSGAAGSGWQAGTVVASQDRGSRLHASFALAAEGGVVALVSPEGDIVSQYGRSGADYPPQAADLSYGVIAGSGLFGEALMGYLARPTPGAANVGDGIAGPVIRGVTDRPAAPQDNEDLVITATVTPLNAPVASVTLNYRVMYGDEASSAMSDDGTGPDLVSGDGIYTGVIPHTASAPGEMVRWSVSALDEAGRGSRGPVAAHLQYRQGLFTFLERFNDGTADGIQTVSGNWNIVDGRYQVTPGPEGDTIATIPALSGLSTDFDIKTVLNIPAAIPPFDQNGDILFDYHSPTDFKFARYDVPQRLFQIGQRDGAGWHVLAERLRTTVPGFDLRITLEIRGSVARILLDTVEMLRHDFGTSLADGLVGLGTENGVATFDNFSVEPRIIGALEAPEYFGTVVVDPAIESNLPVLHWFVEDVLAVDRRTGGSASLYFLGEFYDNILVDLHGQSTGGFPKKAYDVDMNPGHKFKFAEDESRVSDFNLLSNYADKTKLRNTLGYEVYRDASHPYHVAFPIRVQRNASFFGISDWVEEAGTEYLERLGMDPLGALYKVNNSLDSTINEVEKRTRKHEDRSDLQQLVDSSSLEAAEQRAWYFDNLDLASWANFLAGFIVNGNIGCCQKNYYVYRDTEDTGQWQIFPWDVDLSFGHNFNGTEGYFDDDIIINTGLFVGYNQVTARLFQMPEFREMYLRRVRSLLDRILQPPETPQNELKFEARIDELTDQIGNDGLLDMWKWGFPNIMAPQTPREAADVLKNFYLPWRRAFLSGLVYVPEQRAFLDVLGDMDLDGNVTADDIDDFVLALNDPAGYEATHGIPAWRRGNTDYDTPFDLDFDDIQGFVRLLQGNPVHPAEIPEAQVGVPEIHLRTMESAPASGNQDEQYVELVNPNNFAVDISGWRLRGDITHTFRGGTVIPAGGALYVSPNVSAFLARAEGPRGGQGLFVQGSYQGRLSAMNPHVELMALAEGPSPHQSLLRISELNYNPYDPLTRYGDRPDDNDDFEFIELKNLGTESLNLKGVSLTDGVQFTFGDVELVGGQHIVVVNNRSAFESRYGTGHNIAGEFTAGRLDNGGETIQLEDPFGGIILQFTYDDQDAWPARADGWGSTLEVIDPAGNFQDPHNWRASHWFGGTPGDDATGPVMDVIINEVLPGASGANSDRIELRNTTGQMLDVSGWFLSDDLEDLLKYAIPAQTFIEPQGYLVFHQGQFGFGLSAAAGDNVWLVAADAVTGRPARFADHVEFDAAEADRSLGRWPDGDPGAALFPLESPTLGEPNRIPAAGDVFISEVHYAPQALAFQQDFSSGAAAGFQPVLGTWNVTAGRYEVTPGAESDTVSLLSEPVVLPSRFSISAVLYVPTTAPSPQSGAILFDYHGPTDFKFASLDAGADRWRIGARDASGWNELAERAVPIGTNVDHPVTLLIRGSTVTLQADGSTQLVYDFASPLDDGRIGLGSPGGMLRFDDVSVRPLDVEDFAFVELASTAENPVPLAGWQLADAVSFMFAGSTQIGPDRALVVVGFDPADSRRAGDFRRVMGIDESVVLVGPYAGQLSGGERVRLMKPLSASAGAGPAGPGLVLVDQVAYDDEPPWPVEAAGGGKSLNRSDPEAFGDFAASWRALDPTPGNAVFAEIGDLDHDGQIGTADIAALVPALNDPTLYEATYGIPAALAGDVDGNGQLDFDDIAGFVALLQARGLL